MNDMSELFSQLCRADQEIMTELLYQGYASAAVRLRRAPCRGETINTLLASARRLQIYRLSGLYDAEREQRACATITNLLTQVLKHQPRHEGALALLADLPDNGWREVA